MLELYIGCSHMKLKYEGLSKDEKNEIINLIEEKFTATDTSLSFNPMVKRGILTDKKCFYNKEYDLLPTGFLIYLKIYLKKAEIEFKITDIRKFPYIDEKFTNQEVIKIGKYVARDYQIEAMRAMLKAKNGIAQLSTGSGKQLIASMLCKALPKARILFIFDSIDLIDQSYRVMIEEHDFSPGEVGIIQGNRVEDDKRIILLSMQSYEKAFHLFRYVDVICSDECHVTARTDTSEKIIFSCQRASIRIGLTATADLQNPFEQMRLYSNLGPVLYKRTVKEQIDVNAISPVEVELYRIKQRPIPVLPTWADEYEYVAIQSEKHKNKLIDSDYKIVNIDGKEVAKKFISFGNESNMYVRNTERNELICQLAIKNKRVLVIFSRIDHGNNLYKRICELTDSSRVMIVSGKDDITERKKSIKFLEDEENSIVLASTIFSKGIDVKPIETVILCSGGKSNILVIQRVGRALRKSESTGKTKAKVIDFYDETLNKIAKKQSEKRHIIYKSLEIPIRIIE